jgi:hypothetical protein
MKHIDKTAVEKPLSIAYSPRHAKPDTRLGALDPDVRELLEAFVPPAWIRRMGSGR